MGGVWLQQVAYRMCVLCQLGCFRQISSVAGRMSWGHPDSRPPAAAGVAGVRLALDQVVCRRGDLTCRHESPACTPSSRWKGHTGSQFLTSSLQILGVHT